jgi:ferredoxin-NADP reductase
MIIESASPRGDFYLVDDSSPVILVSAGIGATPVMAMAHALASAERPGQIWWLHTTQSVATHAFAAEVTALLARIPHPARTCRSVRRPHPVFMPKRRLPYVRDSGDRG